MPEGLGGGNNFGKTGRTLLADLYCIGAIGKQEPLTLLLREQMRPTNLPAPYQVAS